MASQNQPYDGYPAPAAFDVKIHWAGDHFGPTAYTTGGYTLPATGYGMSRFEWVNTSPRSQSGNYYALVFYPAISGNAEVGAPSFPNVTLKWYNAANNVEVAANTNLNGEVIQMVMIGI